MSEKNILLIALASSFTYPTVRGYVTTEDLFSMPLTAQNGFSLDTVAKTVNNELKALGEESFVEQGDNKQRNMLNDKLEVVKFVIDYKQEANKAAAAIRERRAKRAKLLEALENRENADLAQMSKEEILKQLEEI